MNIIYGQSGMDFELAKNLGFDTVLGTFTVEELDMLKSLSLSCIYHGKQTHDCIVAYYLFDEPEVTNTSIAEQDAKIAEYRYFTDKPLAIAIIEEVERKCSLNFDWYMQDIYYSNKMPKWKNFLNAAISSQCVQILYKRKKVFPIVGLYDDAVPFVYAGETQDKFNRFFRSMFPTQDYAAFYWSTLIKRQEYRDWAVWMNGSGNKVSRFVRPLAYIAAWCFLKINPLFGKYKVTVP